MVRIREPANSDRALVLRNKKAEAQERTCEHPQCVCLQRTGKSAKLLWDNPLPYCGPCAKRVTVQRPHAVVYKPGRTTRRDFSYIPRKEWFFLHNLMELKEQHGYTYGRLQDVTGLGRDTIKNYAKLFTRCHPEKAKVLADVFGVTVEELRGE